ncbi:MAG: CsgG/HfaB family protein [Gemmatimonadaceae bacterium]
MFRQLSSTPRALAMAAALALPTALLAQADTRPIVVVFSFNNNAIGKDHADYDGMSKGVQDLLITDLAANAKIRLVDRSRLQDLLAEQNLSKTGVVDQATAIKVGHMLGAQYAITGGFITDGKTQTRLDSHVIDMETSLIGNPQSVTGKTDDVLGLIAQLSAKVSGNLKLAPKQGAPSKKGGNEGAKGASQTGSAQTSTSSAGKAAVEPRNFAKPSSSPEKINAVKLDVATMKIYSNGLDEMDKKNNAAAKKDFQTVLEKFPGFEPAERNLKRVS